MKEKIDYDEGNNEDSNNKLDKTKSINSEDQNLNINLTIKNKSKNQKQNKQKKSSNKNISLLIDLHDDGDSRGSSIVSYEERDRSNASKSFDCTLGPDIISDELRSEITKFDPDKNIPPLLNKRTHFFKEIPYREILTLEKNELSKPLLKMEDPKDIDAAKQMFRNLISYMKIRKSSKEPIMHAKKMMKVARQGSPILKDEAYLQVYKQLHNNHEYQSFMSAYKMLGILSSCFVPNNKDIFLFILKYLYDEMCENKNVIVLSHIKYICNRILKTKEHERKNAPCKEEIEYIELLKPIPIIVYIFDGTRVNIEVESYTSIKEVKERVIKDLGLDMQSSINYCLYEICTKKDGTEERFLDDNERVCDIISIWKSEMDKDMKNKIDSFYRFYFRILIFSPYENNDKDSLERLYYQNVYDVIAGRFPLDKEKTIILASLELFVEYVDDNSRARQSLEDNLEKFVPKKMMIEYPETDDWIQKIYNKYCQYTGKVTREDAQQNYSEELETLETYQMAQFEAIFDEQKSSVNEDKIPHKCIIGLKPDGISILDEDLTRKSFYAYEKIINWGISNNKLVICIQEDKSLMKRVCFITSQTKVIQTAIEVYCNLKAGRTNKNIKEIVDGYDEKFKSIDSTKKVKELVYTSGGRGSDLTESTYKITEDDNSMNEIVNDDDIFKDRTTNAKLRMSGLNSQKKK